MQIDRNKYGNNKITVDFHKMKAASETNRSLAGTIMYDCFKVVGMTNCFCWAPLLSVPSSSFMLTNSGLFNVNPANFSTPALKVADNMTVCRWPIPPSFSKCSDTKPSILKTKMNEFNLIYMKLLTPQQKTKQKWELCVALSLKVNSVLCHIFFIAKVQQSISFIQNQPLKSS